MTGGNGNGHHARLWQLAIAAVVALAGLVGWLLQREFDSINARLDRVVDYVLEHDQTPADKP